MASAGAVRAAARAGPHAASAVAATPATAATSSVAGCSELTDSGKPIAVRVLPREPPAQEHTADHSR